MARALVVLGGAFSCVMSEVPLYHAFWFGVWGLGFGVWVWGLGFWVWGLGVGVPPTALPRTRILIVRPTPDYAVSCPQPTCTGVLRS
ncbi:hypothetical protein T484DRAFT_1926261 [Baffinella frigidus]|nr:hypothetical protein T484DRAFT_1926261 [Cryptophyta sp. CCMP2293]